MIYKDFQGQNLSALGFGAMRLPVIDGNYAVNEAAVAEVVSYAIENGVNYVVIQRVMMSLSIHRFEDTRQRGNRSGGFVQSKHFLNLWMYRLRRKNRSGALAQVQ